MPTELSSFTYSLNLSGAFVTKLFSKQSASVIDTGDHEMLSHTTTKLHFPPYRSCKNLMQSLVGTTWKYSSLLL